MFDVGVAKVSINTAAVRKPEFLRRAAETFGPSRLRAGAILPTSMDIRGTESCSVCKRTE